MSYDSRLLIKGRGSYNNNVGTNQYARHKYGRATDVFATIEAANYFPDNLDLREDEIKVGDFLEVQDSTQAIKTYRITSLAPITLVVSGDTPFDQSLNTTNAVTFATVNTGQGANELYAMDQNVRTTDPVIFTTVDTGQGANELYPMDQGVKTTDSPTFVSVTGSTSLITDTLNDNGAGFTSITNGIQLPTTGGTPTTLNYFEELDLGSNAFSGPWVSSQNTEVKLLKLNNFVHLFVADLSAAFNAGAVITNVTPGIIPIPFRPVTDLVKVTLVIDNSAPVLGSIRVTSGGDITIYKGTNGTGNFAGPGNSGSEEAHVSWLQA